MKLFKLGGLGRKKNKKSVILDNLNTELNRKEAIINQLNKEIDICNKTIKMLEDDLEKKNGLLKVANFCIEERAAEIDNYKSQIHILNSSKGGYVNRINSLTNELEETKKKLAESMTDKYLIKKIPAGKKPKGQIIRSHTRPLSNQERKRLDELLGLRESNE